MQRRFPAGRAGPRWPLADGAAALVVIAVFWLPAVFAAGSWPRAALGAALAVVTAACMMLRHRLPAAATTAAAAATVAAGLLGVCEDPMLATAWCLYALARGRAARISGGVIALVCVFALLLAVTGVDSGGPGGRRVLLAAAALTAAWLLGTAVGREMESAREAERARVQLDVAREVHDVVGHALGVISAQASVVCSLPDADEPELRATLGDIESHAREALHEIQALVRGLRNPAPAEGGPGLAGRVPSIAELSPMIDDARAAGLTVDAHLGAVPGAGDGTRLVVFRIVQEALNNVLRHAPGARCSVRVSQADEEIRVWIRDHGSSVPGAGTGSGLGLRGMRERATLAGGTVSWRRPAGGGFEVSARLPVAGRR
ncbi:sensor histidine kinase [Micromonospora inaquosa]|uniref:sensor histidine kinase n=1 Tax=Micromonospora inaquosa TaxID=2203716 RepID=UPI000F5F8310|nr:sensor histidine kinase [Micromonospora inaquosa]